MRVVANACFILPGAVGGSEEFTVRLLEAVASESHLEIEVCTVAAATTFAAHPSLASDCHRSVRGPMTSRPFRIATESAVIPRMSIDADVTHHLGGRIPARRRGPTVVTVHDIQPIDLPSNFSLLKRRYLDWAVPRSVRGADIICTPTSWVAQRLIDRFGADPDRLRVVSPAPAIRPLINRDAPEVGALGDRPIVLYPAVTHPHKNHALLLRALEGLQAAIPDVVVVFTGGEGAAHAEVLAEMNRLDPSGARILHLGRVPESSITALLARADVVAFPSRYEGFGLPVIEAMAAGTPVVASNAACIPEVVGDSAPLLDPDAVESWVDTISGLLLDKDARAEQAVAGATRAATFTTKRAADMLVGAWRAAAA